MDVDPHMAVECDQYIHLVAWSAAPGTRDANERDSFGLSLLDKAYAYSDIVELLLDNGANPNDINPETLISPLHIAVKNGDPDSASLLIRAGADVNHRDSDGETPLYWAAEAGRLDTVRLLLSCGADPATDNFEIHDIGYDFRRIEALGFVSDIRRGGGWDAYLRAPRKRLLALRILCERGRAEPPEATPVEKLRSRDLFVRGLQRKILQASTLAEAQSYARAAVAPAPSPPGVLGWLFPWRAPAGDAATTGDAPSRARARGARGVPKEVFWHILKFWRCSRDFP